VGSQFVHVTTDGGNSWQIISPTDAQRHEPPADFRRAHSDNIGVEYAGVIFRIDRIGERGWSYLGGHQ